MESNIDTYNIAKRWILEDERPHVVGLDFCGNPHKNRFQDYLDPIFNDAKESGIKTTLHCAEIQDVYDENEAILDYNPD